MTTPSPWLPASAFRRLRAFASIRRAQQVLAGWEAQWLAHDADPDAQPAPAVPHVRRVQGPRGRPALHVLAADVAALYAVDLADVHQLAA